MKHRLLRVGVAAGGWALLGAVLTLEVYFNQRAPGSGSDFIDIAVPQFVRATLWACLTPFVFKLREKIPLSSGHWVGGILFHLAFSVVVMATFYLGRVEGFRLFFEPEPEGFWTVAFKWFYGHNLVDVAFYWAALAFAFGGELQRKFRSEEIRAAQLETRLIEAELKALREQLKPHFLFNTLNTISVLVRDGKNELAVTLLARLGSLLRMSLEGTRENQTTLRVEMDFLNRYIEIQKARFSDRLTAEISVSEEALSTPVPWLLLQPIVENAILHGIVPKSGPGKVEIYGELADGMLRLRVLDDGPGLPANRRVVEGTGLANTRERLSKIYGEASRMSVKSRETGGMAVEIIIPCGK